MPELISKNSNVEEVVVSYPDTVDVFMDYGIKPIVCGDPVWGTVGEIAEKEGVDIDKLLSDLNNIIKEKG